MFEGSEAAFVEVGQGQIFLRRAGRGRALLLLHGFPETHVLWRDLSPALAKDFTVVCPDLPGYGASHAPRPAPDHLAHSKAAMASSLVEMMARLGFDRFAVAGHDRGGRVAYRMALNHPGAVDALAVLDVLPTGEVLARADARLALAYWPWSLLAQPEPLPERLILGDPAAVVDSALAEWGSDAAAFPPAVREAYVEALRNPSSVKAICEEYRAAAGLDPEHDREDLRAGRRIACPTLALWAQGGPLDDWYQDAGGPLGIWRRWCAEVSGRAIGGGHFFPETNPVETLAELRAFFRRLLLD